MDSKIKQQSILDNKIARVVIVGIITAVFYGTWAFYSNYEFGRTMAIRSAIVQAFSYGIAVCCSASLMEFLFSIGKQVIIKFLLASAGAGGLMLAIFVGIHFVNGTPNMVKTLMLPTLIATPYYILYPLGLTRREVRSPIS